MVSFTYFSCTLLVSVSELHEAILRTGFDVSTLSTAECSAPPEKKKERKKDRKQEPLIEPIHKSQMSNNKIIMN